MTGEALSAPSAATPTPAYREGPTGQPAAELDGTTAARRPVDGPTLDRVTAAVVSKEVRRLRARIDALEAENAALTAVLVDPEVTHPWRPTDVARARVGDGALCAVFGCMRPKDWPRHRTPAVVRADLGRDR